MIRAGDHAYCEMSFSPNVELVTVVRRFVTEFYQQVVGAPELISRLALATHELLENAVKFSLDGDTQVNVRFETTLDGRARIIRVRTRNRATPEHMSALRRQVDAVVGAADPHRHYQELMRATARRADGSGLGLGRILAEADMQLRCELEGDLVTMEATARIGLDGGGQVTP